MWEGEEGQWDGLNVYKGSMFLNQKKKGGKQKCDSLEGGKHPYA